MLEEKRPYPVLRREHHQIGRISVIKDTILTNGHEHPFTYVEYRDSVCILALYQGLGGNFITTGAAYDFSTLERDILENGCYNPNIVNEDMVIMDGHNRFRICEKHGLSFKMLVFSFDDLLEAKRWALDTQKGRNLDNGNRLKGRSNELHRAMHASLNKIYSNIQQVARHQQATELDADAVAQMRFLMDKLCEEIYLLAEPKVVRQKMRLFVHKNHEKDRKYFQYITRKEL